MKGKSEGVFLARFVALTILLSAPIVYLKLNRPDVAIGDLVHGLMFIVPTWGQTGVRPWSDPRLTPEPPP